ncbi:hypothetical protein [Sulfitobacter sabulilitoris]|uniref:Glycosyltransferase family 1 protein n=1 Tax=Sulfitobacter sabulilitoris TaxID=2562655 RepID=A0A5S3PC63_9RHOB|nr:hypothetical protein [Sulfitobacter sabulilitoris]TMM51298.1 hypothetical protein FDT80_15705 [Sulfitobacter sabulilitoris]
MHLNVQSTRLFPKNLGADAYVLTGIAARCDWVFLSDTAQPQTHLVRRVETRAPRHVYLSLRSPAVALKGFVEQVLPLLEDSFVLVSGSEDVTLPNQIDARWNSFADTCPGAVDAILAAPGLTHWFVENLDDATNSKMSPLPLGMVFPDPEATDWIAIPPHIPFSERPIRVLCGHRVRSGAQWDARKRITQTAREHWADWCTVLEEEVTEADFLALMQDHAFVICAEGGGLDPSPKAWQTLLHGSAPIIRSSPTASAYADLPVAFVPDWRPEDLTRRKLADWHSALASRFDAPEARTQIHARLGIEYWWAKIQERARP